MSDIEHMLESIPEPEDYFKGPGQEAGLAAPTSILLFVRRTREKLQQEALQNRSHHRFVLIFNLGTEGQVHVNHRVHELKPGQALLVLPYQFHHFSSLASSRLNWLICTFELNSGQSMEPMRNRVIDPGDTTLAARDGLLEAWHRCQSAPEPLVHLEKLLQTALLRLLFELQGDLAASPGEVLAGSGDSLLRTINGLLREWRGRTVTVQHLAEALDLSESRLRARFKSSAGVSLGAYIQNYRLNRAMALLRTTRLPIAEVAAEAGFGSPQAFSRTFRQETGQSPRAYRAG